MIKYEDYLDRCWFLNTSQASQDFIRSTFDYGTRQRRALRGYDVANMRLTMNWGELIQFKKFWLKLNYGTDKFKTDQPIFGDPTPNKTIRFITAYSITELSYRKFEVTCVVEIIKTSIIDDILNLTCPRKPHVGLTPMVGLTPCGS